MIEQVAIPQNMLKRRVAWFMLTGSIILCLVALLLYAVSTPVFHTAPSLQKVTDVPLPGGQPTFDQQAFDAGSKHLFVTHPGNNEVVIIDTTTNAVVGHIQNIRKNHGIAVIPELNRVYVGETFDNQVYVVDEKTLAILSRIPVGQKPDVISYDPNDHLLFVSNELGHSDAVINVNTNRVIATIPFGGEVGNTRYDPTTHRIFITLQTLNQVVALDPVSRKIVASVTLPKTCNHNHGLILDTSQHLGIVECDVSTNLFLLDISSMQVLTSQPLPQQPDIMAIDEGQHQIYVSSRSGNLAIFNDSNKSLQKVAEECVATNAHSVFVDPGTHTIYMPLLSTSSTVCAVPTPAPTPKPNTTPVPAPVNGQPALRVLQFQ